MVPAEPLGFIQMKGGALVGEDSLQTNVLEPDVLGMADGESPGGLDAVGRRFWIFGLTGLGWLAGFGDKEGIASPLFFKVFHREAPTEQDLYILNADIPYRMSFHTGNEAGIATVGISDADIADADTVDNGRMKALWCSHPVA